MSLFFQLLFETTTGSGLCEEDLELWASDEGEEAGLRLASFERDAIKHPLAIE
jgi:hypothetical protein